jgi:hypothetical protein
MRKLITISLAVLLMGLSAAVVYAAVQSGDDTSSTTGTTETTETTETTTTPQHRERGRGDDRRENRREDRREARRADDRGVDDRGAGAPATGVDVSGPCDEAEHANDPRCTGVTPKVEDDHRAGDDGVRHDVGDDHGGDRGEVEDHSGPGRGGDDSGEVEDHSGSGRGGDDSGGDDHSGSGHGGRDHEEDD